MTGLVLDPDDGRALWLSKPVFPSPFEPQPVLHLIEDPDGSAQRAMNDSLNEMIHRAHLDYVGEVEAKAAELAALGFGLEEVERGTDVDEYNPNLMRIRGTFRVVPLLKEDQ